MLTAGILDPAKVVRIALQDAASIAGLMITTEAMVAETPKEETLRPCRAAAAWAAWAGWTTDRLNREATNTKIDGRRDGSRRPLFFQSSSVARLTPGGRSFIASREDAFGAATHADPLRLRNLGQLRAANADGLPAICE